MLDIMTRMSVTYDELDAVWPWSRVLSARDAITNDRFVHAFPVANLHATYIRFSVEKGVNTPTALDLLPPGAVPIEIVRERERKLAELQVYSPAIIEAFTLARSLGYTSAEHLQSFGVEQLRASGWGKSE